MADNLAILRAGGVVHKTFRFSDEDVARFEALTPAEVAGLITARKTLGEPLCTIRDDSDKVHPDTVPI